MDEAKRNAAVLANFPGDAWYADAYRLMTDEGVQPTVKPTKGAHRRGCWPFGKRGEDRTPHKLGAPPRPRRRPKTPSPPASSPPPP